MSEDDSTRDLSEDLDDDLVIAGGEVKRMGDLETAELTPISEEELEARRRKESAEGEAADEETKADMPAAEGVAADEETKAEEPGEKPATEASGETEEGAAGGEPGDEKPAEEGAPPPEGGAAAVAAEEALVTPRRTASGRRPATQRAPAKRRKTRLEWILIVIIVICLPWAIYRISQRAKKQKEAETPERVQVLSEADQLWNRATELSYVAEQLTREAAAISKEKGITEATPAYQQAYAKWEEVFALVNDIEARFPDKADILFKREERDFTRWVMMYGTCGKFQTLDEDDGGF